MLKGKLTILMAALMAVMALGTMGCPAEDEGAVEVGVHYEGARIGLVVPEYVDIDCITELNDYADEFGGEIVGIDAGAGIMSATEEAIDVYGLDLGLLEGSDAGMTAELETRIANEEWIVVTGWAPHWKMAEWDLKFLEDPELVYGGEEYIGNVARGDLQEDMPGVYAFLENFSWGDDEIGAVMEMNAEDDDYLGNAQAWIADNRAMVDGWLEGVEGEGEVEIVMVEWDCATASTYVAKAALMEAGYDVEVTAVDAGVMWSSVAAGDVDFFVCAWLPGTHADYWEEYGVE